MYAVQNRFTKDEYRQYLTVFLDGVDRTNKAVGQLAHTARQWDGMVLNKRFINAVNEWQGYGRFSLGEKDYSGAINRINFYLNERSVQIQTKKGRAEFSFCCYYDDEILDIIYFDTDALRKDDKGNYRINGEVLARYCQQVIDNNNRKANIFKDALKNWDKSLEAIADIALYATKKSARINPLFVDLDGARTFLYDCLYKPSNARFQGDTIVKK